MRLALASSSPCPYLIDRVVAPRLSGLLATLVFPLAVTTGWYLIALIPSAGTIFNPAYTQYRNLPLVSVTGLWGIVFLMNWLAGLLNWAWEQGFAWSKVRPGWLAYSSLLVLIDPSGHILSTYQKAHPVPGEENLRLVLGDGQIPVAATPYGRLATTVCYDRDFLDIISRVGRANADILLVPTGDWRDIDPYHTQMTTFAAIETGSSQVSQASYGRSVAVDTEGPLTVS